VSHRCHRPAELPVDVEVVDLEGDHLGAFRGPEGLAATGAEQHRTTVDDEVHQSHRRQTALVVDQPAHGLGRE
jgi:hypothetical protein